MASKISPCRRTSPPIFPWVPNIAWATLELNRWKLLKCRPARISEKMTSCGLPISTTEFPKERKKPASAKPGSYAGYSAFLLTHNLDAKIGNRLTVGNGELKGGSFSTGERLWGRKDDASHDRLAIRAYGGDRHQHIIGTPLV